MISHMNCRLWSMVCEPAFQPVHDTSLIEANKWKLGLEGLECCVVVVPVPCLPLFAFHCQMKLLVLINEVPAVDLSPIREQVFVMSENGNGSTQHEIHQQRANKTDERNKLLCPGHILRTSFNKVFQPVPEQFDSRHFKAPKNMNI